MTGSNSRQPAPEGAPGGSGDLAVPSLIALLGVLLHVPVLSRYGFHRDELYFAACGERLALGYADHPPWVPWVARLAVDTLGESVVALRLPALAAGALAILLAGALARELGGGRFAQGLASLSVLIAPVFLRVANVLAIPSFEPVFWLGATWALVRVLRGGHARGWLLVGAIAGLGLLNKHTMGAVRARVWSWASSPRPPGPTCGPPGRGSGVRSRSRSSPRTSCGRPSTTGSRSASSARSTRA